MLQYETSVLRITALVVDAKARRRGTSKLLMDHDEDLTAAAGC